MMTNEQFTCLAQRYIDTVYRVAFNYIKSSTDADDITQNVFLKLFQESKTFESEEHVKHWLIRVTLNECRNLVKSCWWRHESLEGYAQKLAFDNQGQSDVFHTVMSLPRKYRIPIYLYYYEGYSTLEIGELLQLSKNTVCTRLMRGRELLKKTLTEVDNDV